ncbi:MAG TPA: aldo/keto reductase [bacterium]|nr:aldo/keto reductase [bacterium]
MTKYISRREFLKNSALTAAVLGIAPNLAVPAVREGRDSKGLPTRTLGNTKEVVPPLALGTGSRFCAVEDEDEALELLTYALDHGFYYWDTAHSYDYNGVVSEERLGKILKHRRNEVFLSTKVDNRDPDAAKAQIEQSLTRLQTDHVDILKIHSIQSTGDARDIGSPNGVLQVVQKAKEEGLAKYIGFTGHTSAEAMAMMAEQYDFDTMLIALNHYQQGNQPFEEKAIPTAKSKGMGVIVMKVIRPRETVRSVTPRDLIRYALSLKNADAAVVGTDSLQVLKENIQLVKNFTPMTDSEMEEMHSALTPFYRHQGLEWMEPHYQDGYRT